MFRSCVVGRFSKFIAVGNDPRVVVCLWSKYFTDIDNEYSIFFMQFHLKFTKNLKKTNLCKVKYTRKIKKVLTRLSQDDRLIPVSAHANAFGTFLWCRIPEKRRIPMTSVFGFLVAIIIVSIIVIIVDGVSRVLPKSSL